MADSSENTLAMIAEVTPGTTPATPAFNLLRITGETLTANYETLISNEIRPDATVSDIRRTGVSVAGDVNFELHSDPDFDVMLGAALRGAWATNTLKGGVLRPSYTFERKIVGSGGNAYMQFAGSRIGGMSLNLTPDEIITGSFRVMGTAHGADDAIITGATYAAAATNPVMAGIDVTSLVVSGITGVDYQSMTLDIENNLRVQRKLGSASARGVGYGRRAITGSIVCYFEDLAAYEDFLANEAPSIVATVSDGTKSYTITLPKVRLLGGEVPTPGNDQDVMLTLNYQAMFDGTLNTDIQIVRVP